MLHNDFAAPAELSLLPAAAIEDACVIFGYRGGDKRRKKLALLKSST